MNNPQHPSPSQAHRPTIAVGTLVIWTLAGLMISGAAIGVVLMAVGRVDWWQGFLAAAVVSTIAAVAGLGPVILAARSSVNTILAGWLAGTGLRAMFALGGAMVAALAYKTPPVPTLLLMVIFYMSVLACETIVVARALSRGRSESSHQPARLAAGMQGGV